MGAARAALARWLLLACLLGAACANPSPSHFPSRFPIQTPSRFPSQTHDASHAPMQRTDDDAGATETGSITSKSTGDGAATGAGEATGGRSGTRGSQRAQPPQLVTLGVDYAAFLAKHDMLWHWTCDAVWRNCSAFVPATWYQSAYVGNGVLGVSVRAAAGIYAAYNSLLAPESSSTGLYHLRLYINRADLWDCGNRQPVGWLDLMQRGTVTEVSMRQAVYNGELTVNISTTLGSTNVTLFTNAADLDAAVLVAQVNSSGNERPWWRWQPDNSSICANNPPAMTRPLHTPSGAGSLTTQYTSQGSFTTAVIVVGDGRNSTRLRRSRTPAAAAAAAAADVHASPAAQGCAQVHAGASSNDDGDEHGDAAVCMPAPVRHTLFLTVQSSQRKAAANASASMAVTQMMTATALGAGALRAANSAWWAAYWPLSFLSFDTDTKLLGFYYIQMARYAMGGRAALHDLMGPFGPSGIDLCLGPWCAYVYDMNAQVMLQAAPTSNRAAVWAQPAYDMFPSITAGTWYAAYGSNPPSPGPDMLWLLRELQKHALYTGNQTVLLSQLYPLLQWALANSYLRPGSSLQRVPTPSPGGGGNSSSAYSYWVINCYSPEYPYACAGQQPTPVCTNCNYDLAILRWSLGTLLAIAQAYDSANPQIPAWLDIYMNLAPYPTDATGFRISVEAPFAYAHRHYSHLLMLFDLDLVGGLSDASVAAASLDNWYALTCAAQQAGGFNQECRGFTQMGMAYMSALLNRTAAVVGNISALLDSVITPNAQYGEEVWAGNPQQYAPVSESAYGAAAAIQDALLQSGPMPPRVQAGYNDSGPAVIRLWPASPWANASIYNLRAAGAFLVSAVKVNGATHFVSLTADNGATPQAADGTPAPVVPSVPDWAGASVIALPDNVTVAAVPAQAGVFEVGLARGAAVVLYPAPVQNQPPPLPFVVVPAAGDNRSEYNFFGYQWQLPSFHAPAPSFERSNVE